jgi:antitoxin component YwqK of YwqJK toxin-antitoxin module
MEGKWIFNRESGDLWQIGNFKNDKKHGQWIRYDKTGKVEYDADFENGKLIKKRK